MCDLMAGKTAPASLMLSSYICTNGVFDRPSCVGTPGLDGSITTMKPYSSAPNIDLLHHTEPSLLMRSNEAEDILRLHGVRPVGQKCAIDKQQGQSIPEIVVVSCNEDNGSMGEICAHTDEPDIVQSTKSSSLPRQGAAPLPHPVAPPRRKKTKTPSPLAADVANEVCVSQLLRIFIHCFSHLSATSASSISLKKLKFYQSAFVFRVLRQLNSLCFTFV